MNCNFINQIISTNSNGEEEITLECTSCFDGYLLNNEEPETLCNVLHPFQREIDSPEAQADSCELRHPTNGLCLKCPDHLIYDAEFKNCQKISTGIPNCQIYLTSSFCSHCKANFYLSQNQCLPVSTTVANCYWYSSDKHCSRCNGGFELKITKTTDILGEEQIETVCEEKSVLNCSVFDHVHGLCKECNAGFYLVRESVSDPVQAVQSKIDSRKLQETSDSLTKVEFSGKFIYTCREENIENCISYCDNISKFYKPTSSTQNEINYFDLTEFPSFLFEDNSYKTGPICHKCAPNYFLNNNVCELIETSNEINNCEEYFDSTTCKICSQNFVLTKER